MTKSVVRFGRNYPSDEVTVETFSNGKITIAISAGKSRKPNEDALCVSTSLKETILAVADGHWGYEASEMAVRRAAKMLRPSGRNPRGNEMRGRLYSLFQQINSALFDMATKRVGAPVAETSLVVCYLLGGAEPALYWASFGDSYLFVQKRKVLRQLNRRAPCWLGMLSQMAEHTGFRGIHLRYQGQKPNRYLGVSVGLETGIKRLRVGDLIIVCSDGLVEPTKDANDAVTLTDLRSRLAASSSVEDKTRDLVRLAFERGGEDNIACILAQV